MANEPHNPPGPDDVALVRQTLMRELETINAYEHFARSAASEEVRRFLAHLGAEEKEHVSEATAMLRRLDAEQDRHFQSGQGPEHYLSAGSDEGASRPAPPPISAAFTVGSLRGARP